MLSFFISHKSAGSPYINHFLQPDSIIPDYTNPQSWNRYAYVMNNPIGFNDPTGHCSKTGDAWCFEENGSGISGGNGGGGNGGGGGGNSGGLCTTLDCLMGSDAGGNIFTPSGESTSPFTADGYIKSMAWSLLCNKLHGLCSNGQLIPLPTLPPLFSSLNSLSIALPSNPSNQNLNDIATHAQDIALMVSIAGAGGEIAGAIIGCGATWEFGCLPGAYVGWLEAVAIYDFAPIPGIGLSGNQVQSYLSGVSTTATLTSGLRTGSNTILPFRNIHLNESTATSLFTNGLSMVSPSAIPDSFLNGYGSMYNHGYLCGVYNPFNCP